MAGVMARRGFNYQDGVLVLRALDHVIAKRRALIAEQQEPEEPTFLVEAIAIGSTNGPDWDLQQQTPSNGFLVLEEVKSGPVVREHRLTFWQRARRTLATASPNATAIRLTFNPERPPDNLDRWHELAVLAQSEPANNLPAAVRSSATLAQEALYMLTSHNDDSSVPLSEITARMILSGFEINEGPPESTLRTAIEGRLRLLAPDAGIESLYDAITGFVARRASSLITAEHTFRASDLETKVELLRRLAAIEPASLRLWEELHRQSKLTEPTARAGTNGLSYQSWESLQPDIAATIASKPTASLALIGTGGLGKSVILEELRSQDTREDTDIVSVAGSTLKAITPSALLEAIQLGIFLAESVGRRLHLYVDSLESLGEVDVTAHASVLGRIATLPSASVRLSCRTPTWIGIERTGSITGLQRFDLREWDLLLVKSLIGASHRPDIGEDLIHLLRTPLLLDIFLRTFGLTEAVPSGLHSRHSVLAAYWQRRILPSADPAAPARRATLERLAAEECGGRTAHAGTEPALPQLESEGLLSSHLGRFRFRHSLLRDFTVAQFALEHSVSVVDLVAVLSQVADALVRFGVLRALTEAICPTEVVGNFTAAEILPALAQSSLEHDLAVVLGELEDVDRLFAQGDETEIFTAALHGSSGSGGIRAARNCFRSTRAE